MSPFAALLIGTVGKFREMRVCFATCGHYSGMAQERRTAAVVEELGEWSVSGMTALLDAVYWTEPIDDDWHWCVECECLVETPQLVDHLCRQHQDCRPTPR